MSLFLRIFLSFWLVAALLAVSFFSLGRLSSGKTIEHAQTQLKTKAELVAEIWRQGGRRHTMHWLFQQSSRSRLLLLNETGESPFSMKNMGMDPRNIGLSIHNSNQFKINHALNYPLKTGIQYQSSGQLSLIEQLPKIKPKLFLVQTIDTAKLYQLPTSLWLLIAFITISFISYILARTLSRRIFQLRQATQKLAEGDLDSRVIIAGKDEVSALANDFNQMAQQLQSMLKSQRQLVSDVSHELRSPLARLRIALELAERTDAPQKMLSRIEKEADELESLVTDLLSLARIESSQFVLDKKSVCLCKLLKKIIEDANFEGNKQQKQVLLQHCDKAIIEADPVLMRSALENIIRNALRYTPSGSQVIVKLILQDSMLTISIEDQGSGVPAEALETLFEPFSRVSKARDRKTGGFGLGLAITGRVIKAHGGELKAENKPEGGLRVKIKLSPL